MPERTEYAPGTPSWVDLAAPDLDKAKEFYGGLFGWEAQEAGPSEETGGYGFFMLNGRQACGFGPPGEGEPPSWRSYVSVNDADEIAAKVKDAGGDVVLDPVDVMDAGRVATFKDKEGAVICAWQPGSNKGAQIVNEPGAFAWSELATRDPDAAKSFYTSVFGWDTEDLEMGETAYIQLQIDGRPVGGMLPLTEEAPDEIEPHWLVYFAVDDLEKTLGKADELGGEVVAPERETPAGGFAVLRDPNGAGFAVIQPSQQDEGEG